MKKHISLLLLLLSPTLFAQTPCKNGMANGYPCNLITLQSHIPASELQGTQVNDIWGWTDPDTGKEYALVGLSDGVTFVDISTPTSPLVIGKLIETHDHGRTDEIQHGESAWRDIKVYSNHAYVVSDLNEEHGMQIFDLTQLRDFDGSEVQEFTQTARYTGIGSAHNMVINEETGFGYIVGISSGSGSCIGGGLHILDLEEPSDPKYVACFDNDGYTHDAQCVIYNGVDANYNGMEICFNSNEDTFTIVNTENKDDISMISRTSYNDAGYTHQGWLSEDHSYFFMNDEFDEGNNRYNPRTIIWDVRDLANPIHIGDFYNEAVSIDHNLYTHKGLIYESNYSSGLRVLDYSRAANSQLREVAFFDTQPQSDVFAYEGSWSNYPYFESGNIIVSDMANGLFVLRLEEVTDPISEHPMNIFACGGTDQTFSVEISEENLTYQWQLQNGTVFEDLMETQSIKGTNTNSLTVPLGKNTAGSHYRVKVFNENGEFFYSFPAMLDYSNSPIADFTSERTDNTIAFTNLSQNADSYSWDFGDGQISTEENPTHEYSNGGFFNVTLSASNECSTGTVSIETDIPLGIENLEITIFPNPTSDILNIQLLEAASIQIYSLSGERVYSEILEEKSNSINIGSIPSGVYLLSVESKGQRTTRKISIK
ncbi:MAG: choice-of-anchor B family protein [Ekhidna sp.]